MKAAIAVAIALVMGAVFALRPVCVPLSDADVRQFTVPIG